MGDTLGHFLMAWPQRVVSKAQNREYKLKSKFLLRILCFTWQPPFVVYLAQPTTPHNAIWFISIYPSSFNADLQFSQWTSYAKMALVKGLIMSKHFKIAYQVWIKLLYFYQWIIISLSWRYNRLVSIVFPWSTASNHYTMAPCNFSESIDWYVLTLKILEPKWLGTRALPEFIAYWVASLRYSKVIFKNLNIVSSVSFDFIDFKILI